MLSWNELADDNRENIDCNCQGDQGIKADKAC
jgi:hypothetical protein